MSTSLRVALDPIGATTLIAMQPWLVGQSVELKPVTGEHLA